MNIFFLTLVCLTIYWLWKRFKKKIAINKAAKDIDLACHNFAHRLISVNNRVDSDFVKDTENIGHIASITGALREAYGIKLSPNSFASNYFKAVENRDYKYLRRAHNYLTSIVEENLSDATFTKVVFDFIRNDPPAKLIFHHTFSYQDFYAAYIKLVKEIDASSDQNAPHWLELTDEEGVKRAYQDGISPEKLARHVLDKTKITDILF